MNDGPAELGSKQIIVAIGIPKNTTTSSVVPQQAENSWPFRRKPKGGDGQDLPKIETNKGNRTEFDTRETSTTNAPGLRGGKRRGVDNIPPFTPKKNRNDSDVDIGAHSASPPIDNTDTSGPVTKKNTGGKHIQGPQSPN